MKKNQIDIITMGCSKNLVDSEQLMRKFENQGYVCVHDSENPEGEIVVINTCGFIETAKEESINTILEFVEAKKEGRLNRVYVMGCLSQRYKDELEESIPEVDKFYGKFNYTQLLSDLGPAEGFNPDGHTAKRLQRAVTTPKHYAYVKIAEGCDRHCAYCAIPIITGKHISRPMDEILDEVRELVAEGVKEFQVIAQELTYYGVDIDGKHHITELISRMADIPGVEWIRLHYAYPNQFPMDLLDVMRQKPNVCNYLDIALQHNRPRQPHALRHQQPSAAFLGERLDSLGESLRAERLAVAHGAEVFQVHLILGELRFAESLHLEGQVLEIPCILALLCVSQHTCSQHRDDKDRFSHVFVDMICFVRKDK